MALKESWIKEVKLALKDLLERKTQPYTEREREREREREGERECVCLSALVGLGRGSSEREGGLAIEREGGAWPWQLIQHGEEP